MANPDHENAPRFSVERRKSTITAFFGARGDAEAAAQRLQDAGVADVRLMPGYEADIENSESESDDRRGFWTRLEDWLFPDEDRAVYAEGLRRGGFLVSASVGDSTYATAHDILDAEGSIDTDERADLWRIDGWGAADAERTASRDDVIEAGAAAGAATGVGRSMRRDNPSSRRVRAYDLENNATTGEEDDVLPTGHQRSVSEDEKPVDPESQSQELDDLRQDQNFPRGR